MKPGHFPKMRWRDVIPVTVLGTGLLLILSVVWFGEQVDRMRNSHE